MVSENPVYVQGNYNSDNTDPFDRLSMQDGFTYAYTPQVMMAWVTDSPHWFNARSTSLTYRMLSSMQGSLGIGSNLNHWTAEDFATAKRLITAYHSVQRTIVRGNRLVALVAQRNASVDSPGPDDLHRIGVVGDRHVLATDQRRRRAGRRAVPGGFPGPGQLRIGLRRRYAG